MSLAAKACVGARSIPTYNDRLDFVSRIISRGHESVIEHTNIVILLHFKENLLYDFITIASKFQYLYWNIRKDITEDNIYHVVIGGSIRGFKHIFRTTSENSSNQIYEEIKNCLYMSSESVFYKDLIDDKIMDEDMFGFIPKGITTEVIKNDKDPINIEKSIEAVLQEPNYIRGSMVDIIESHDKFFDVFNKIKKYGFTLRDAANLVKITVAFHDISRAISMQIIRHRNAISQESTRYVDCSGKEFVDPTRFDDSLESDTVYVIDDIYRGTPKEIGNKMIDIYSTLRDCRMKKEHARAFLPQNIKTRLVVTFTCASLMHFFNLRMDKAAQDEIQAIAKELNRLYFDHYDKKIKESIGVESIMDISEKPQYWLIRKDKLDLNESIDEVINEEEVK